MSVRRLWNMRADGARAVRPRAVTIDDQRRELKGLTAEASALLRIRSGLFGEEGVVTFARALHTPCWMWQGRAPGGTPQLHGQSARRLAFWLWNGRPPATRLTSRCGLALCVSPVHAVEAP